jgi:hypothetical protein
MDELFANGRIVDLILLFMVGEAIALCAYHYVTGKGLEPLDVLIALIPGACLLLALRGALTDVHWNSIALWLGAALVAHLVDLWRRQCGI